MTETSSAADGRRLIYTIGGLTPAARTHYCSVAYGKGVVLVRDAISKHGNIVWRILFAFSKYMLAVSALAWLYVAFFVAPPPKI